MVSKRRLNRGDDEGGHRKQFNAENEPEQSHLFEISDDQGNHAVARAKNKREAERMMRLAREHGAIVDTDEGLSRLGEMAQKRWRNRDHGQLRARFGQVVEPDEDLEPEEDDDSVAYRNESPVDDIWDRKSRRRFKL